MAYKPSLKKMSKSKKYGVKITPTCVSFSLSLPGLCAIIFIGIMALSWSFIFGILIGRGYSPKHNISEIGQLIINDTPYKNIEKQPILKPENLHFMHELKQDTNPPNNKEKKKIHNSSQQSEINLQQLQTSSSSQDLQHSKLQQNIPAESTSLQQQNNIKEQAKQMSPKNNSMIYSFIFQIASFRKKIQADNLREKLEEKGFRTQLVTTKDEKGEIRWYHVRVLLRGINSDAIVAKDTFLQLKLKDTKIISQQPTGKYR